MVNGNSLANKISGIKYHFDALVILQSPICHPAYNL